MSKINYKRKDTWRIKLRKPVSMRPTKPMGFNKYSRHHIKQTLQRLLKEVSHEAHEK